MFLTHRIEEMVAQATDTRRASGAFVLRERAHLADYTIADIARETYASKASVTRFAKTLGFDGWRDFIHDFMAEVHFEQAHSAAVDPNYPFAEGDRDEQVVTAIADAQYDAVSDTLRTLNRGALALAVRYLTHARSVHVFGVSPNTYLGELFCRKMLSIGKTACVVHPDENGVTARSLTPDDCALIISYSGNNASENPMQVVPALTAGKVPTIAITGEGQNYLRRNVRCTLTISSREALYDKIATFETEASILFLLNALFSCCFARSYEKNLAYKRHTARTLEQSREAAGLER